MPSRCKADYPVQVCARSAQEQFSIAKVGLSRDVGEAFPSHSCFHWECSLSLPVVRHHANTQHNYTSCARWRKSCACHAWSVQVLRLSVFHGANGNIAHGSCQYRASMRCGRHLVELTQGSCQYRRSTSSGRHFVAPAAGANRNVETRCSKIAHVGRGDYDSGSDCSCVCHL